MALIGSILMLAAFTVFVFQLWERLTQGENARRWLWKWHIKGVAVPVLVWLVLGVGVVPGLPGLIANRHLLRMLDISGLGVIVIVSWWAGLTIAWLTVTVTREIPPENHVALRNMWLVRSLLLLPVAALVVHGTGWGGIGVGLTAWLLPVAHGLVNLRTVTKPILVFAPAIAKMKFGKFEEAEQEVIKQLEKSDDDFQGWMMLAELYACHFNDLPGAAGVVRDLCDQPNVSPSDAAVALHKLADWQLRFADDPVAARRSLGRICTLFPDTHLAFMAQQRIDQLPASTEELLERRKPRLIRLPKRGPAREMPAAPAPCPEILENPAAAAEACVTALKQNPDDVTTRERFARLLAERLDRAALAIEQLELLLEMKDQPGAKRAEWLRLMAHWQLRHLQDLSAGRKTLQRIVDDFHGTGDGFEAQRRLHLLEAEERFRKGRVATTPTT